MEGSVEKRLYYAAAWREKRLYDAAAKGNTKTLQELLEQDEFLVDRVSFTSPNKSTPLHVSTMNGHEAFVQKILIFNPNLAQQLDSQQSSPLHIASAQGHVAIVDMLLLAAPHMCMSRDCQGRTPLHHAVLQQIFYPSPGFVHEEIVNSYIASAEEHLAIVKKLLSAAPHMCLSRDCQGRNPLHLAAMKGHVEILKALIQEAPTAVWEKADRDQTVLHLCVKHGQLEALKILAPKLNLNPNLENRLYELLEEDPKGDAKSLHELLEEDPKRLEKRLYDAAAEGNTESLQELLEKDEFLLDRVSFTSPNKTTPLHVATMNGHLDFVEDLLYHNSDLAQQLDSQQSSPLHIASAEGYLEIVEKLLEAAPHMCMSRDCQGRTPLHHAVVREFLIYKPDIYPTISHFHSTDPDINLEIVKKLLSAAPDMCLSRDCQGRNPLHLAAMKGHVDILDALIQEAPSAAREMVDRDQTVLHLCVKHGQLDALKILAPKLYDRIDAKDADGDTILHMAVALKQTEIIGYLVGSTKIDLNVRNSNRRTAIEILENSQPHLVRSTEIEESQTAVDILEESHTEVNILEESQPAVATVDERNIPRNILRSFKLIDTKIRTQTHRVNKWLTEKGTAIMVVAVLIATVAFQAGVSPAGGIWQENSTQYSHGRAGEAVMAYTHPVAYKNFMRSNMIAFVSSVTTIVLLMSDLPFKRWIFMWILIIIMWLTVTALTVSYAISVFVVTPRTLEKSMSSALKIGLGVWFAVMGILLIWIIVKWLMKRRTDRKLRLTISTNSRAAPKKIV